MKPFSLLWTLFILLVVCSAYAYIIFAITLTGGRLLDLSDYFFFAAMALIGWVIEVFFVLVLQKRERKKRTLFFGQKVRLREAGTGSY